LPFGVLEKCGGMKLGQQDVFYNVAGRIRVDDPCLPLVGSLRLLFGFPATKDTPVSEELCFARRLGLVGTIRAYLSNRKSGLLRREKLGFQEDHVSPNIDQRLRSKKYKGLG